MLWDTGVKQWANRAVSYIRFWGVGKVADICTMQVRKCSHDSENRS